MRKFASLLICTILLTLCGCGKSWGYMEVFNETEMYRDFLRGVAAIGNGELDFTEIEENLEGVDWEAGTGSRSITFKWQGNLYTLEAEVMGGRFYEGYRNAVSGNFLTRVFKVIVSDMEEGQ